MILQQPDSLHTKMQSEVQTPKAKEEELQIERHTYEELSKLPANATPAEEDKLLQSIYSKPQRRESIPDTTQTAQDSIARLQTEQSADSLQPFYLESFFAHNNPLYSETEAGRMGIAGDPIPFNMRSDNVLASIVIISTLLLIFCTTRASRFFSFHYRNFFRLTREDSILSKESSSDLRYLLYNVFHATIILSLVFFFYTKEHISETYITHSEYTLMGIYLAEICMYLIGQHLLQRTVNLVFFTKKQCQQWSVANMMLLASMGVMLAPLLILLAFFGIKTQNALIYIAIVVILVKISTFYKVFLIFFKKFGATLQYFLYLCTLEIIPLLLLMGLMLLTANYLKVNY